MAAYRAAARACAARAEAEPKPARRKRRGETGGLFRRAARRFARRFNVRAWFGKMARQAVRRVPAPPPEAYAEAVAYLADTLDWLRLWEDEAAADAATYEGEFDAVSEHLSPSP